MQEVAMKVLHRRCAGLDVHKDVVVACGRWLLKRKASYALARFALLLANPQHIRNVPGRNSPVPLSF
jgi:hypothetical protein